MHAASARLAPNLGAAVDLPDATTFDLRWLANWIRKLEHEHGLKTGVLARMCHTQSPRISQLKNPEKYDSLPGVELFWRLMAILHEQPEWADLSDDAIRAVLFRALVSIGPSRMHYLASLSTSEAQAMIDEHERKAASRQRLSTLDTTESEAPEKDKLR